MTGVQTCALPICEVVQDHDVPRSQRGHKDLLDVGSERVGVDGPIEYRRRRQFGGPERRDHGVRFPMAARRVIRDARAAQAARVATEQIGRDPGFVHEDVAGRIVERQRLAPSPASGNDVMATLFVRVYGFF